VRIENMLFDGVAQIKDGRLSPDRASPGNGLAFKKIDVERYAA